MNNISVYIHDSDLASYAEKAGPIHVEPVHSHERGFQPEAPYYRVRIGELALFMNEPRLRELGRLCLEAPPLLPKVNAAGATQSEDCAIAQDASI